MVLKLWVCLLSFVCSTYNKSLASVLLLFTCVYFYCSLVPKTRGSVRAVANPSLEPSRRLTFAQFRIYSSFTWSDSDRYNVVLCIAYWMALTTFLGSLLILLIIYLTFVLGNYISVKLATGGGKWMMVDRRFACSQTPIFGISTEYFGPTRLPKHCLFFSPSFSFFTVSFLSCTRGKDINYHLWWSG